MRVKFQKIILKKTGLTEIIKIEKIKTLIEITGGDIKNQILNLMELLTPKVYWKLCRMDMVF